MIVPTEKRRTRSMPPALVALVAAIAVATWPRATSAQGTLSTQGLGFPPGQLSARAAAMGGSIGEGDPLSPLNPAAISLLRTAIIHMQAEPEFRELRVGSGRQRTSVSRFPLFFGSIPVGARWAVSASASTLFDRSWLTTTRDTQVVSGETVPATISRLSQGALVDLRVATSYAWRPWLRFGVGGHSYSGHDGLRTVRAFDDSIRFVVDTQRTQLGYGGTAVSFGVQTLWPGYGAVGLTYRRGGTLSTYRDDVRVGSASAPDHFGVSAAYMGVTGATLAVRVAHDRWSRLGGLTPGLVTHEGWDVGLGGEALGPGFGGGVLSLRAGARWRTLPFSPTADAVRERSFSGGVSVPMARQRVELTMGVIRALRSGPVGATEAAWTASTGFSVRP